MTKLEKFKLMLDLSLQEFKATEAGSSLGFAWVLIQPAFYMTIVSVVHSVFFRRVGGHEDLFFIWFLPGIIPWLFISSVMSSSCTIFQKNSHLIKTKSFPLWMSVIPKIISSFFSHFILLAILMTIFILVGEFNFLYTLNVIYFTACSAILLFSICLFCSTLYPFARDINNFMSIVIQLAFWSSPIFYDSSNLPNYLYRLIRYNPFFSILLMGIEVLF